MAKDNRRYLSLDEMRQIQLDILNSVHEFCQSHGLRYSLGGGTLLGAVRHKGYIPWDDDIDIMLPRPDYERFLREYPGTNDRFSFQNARIDPQCFLMFTKMYDNRTILEEDVRLRNGVAIDVFPIDGLPSPDEMDEYLAKLSKTHHALISVTPLYGYTPWQVFRYSFLRQLKYLPRKINLRRLKNILTSYDFNTSEYAGAVSGRYGMKEHMPKSVFQSYITLPFEGREYMAIKDYDAYLTKHYGDYMQLPPKEKQVSEHPFKAWWK